MSKLRIQFIQHCKYFYVVYAYWPLARGGHAAPRKEHAAPREQEPWECPLIGGKGVLGYVAIARTQDQATWLSRVWGP